MRFPVIKILIAISMISCSRPKDKNDDTLLRYGDKVITYSEVVDKIPLGLAPEDSAALFRSIIDGWVKDMVLSDFAEQRLYDTEAIERKVREYRNNLIVQEYLSLKRESQETKVDEKRVEEYFRAHQNELKLEVPLVKGVMMKVALETPDKDKIKVLLTSNDPNKIDKLEQDWEDKATGYDYFLDKWISWETLAQRIPYRFQNADDFLKEKKFFTIDEEEDSYYLLITDWIASGEDQPYEFAKSWIADLLTQGELKDYENQLVVSLVDKSLKEKKLETIGYDPRKHEIINNNNKGKDETK